MRSPRTTLALSALLALSLVACDSGVTPDPDTADALDALGRRAKVLVCHVGSELPPYDPACTEACGDAGKVDLISVANVAKHIGNPAHMYDGVSDYDPIAAGATGVGKEDSDGNGVDDGCEIPGAGNPNIDIEKATNGVDADDPNAADAPQIEPGGVVTWTYVVTNTGDVNLEDVTVTDDQGVAVTCPQSTLVVGESMTCTASGLAEDLSSTGFTTVPGTCGSTSGSTLYENMGQVSAEPVGGGGSVSDTDPSHYCNPEVNPDIDIEKATNGVDADDPNDGDAPQIEPGNVVTWTYVVTNTGDVALENVVVTDDQGVAVSCPQTTLGVGESMTCTASGLAEDLSSTSFTTVPGTCGGVPNEPLYENMGQVSAEPVVGGGSVSDTDPSHYCNPTPG